MIDPDSIPTSHLTRGSSAGKKEIIFPVTGKKSLFGSSAYSLTSIELPNQSISDWS